MTGLTLSRPGTDQAPASVVCFGAAIVDLIAHADHIIKRDTSTPGAICRGAGGVAANVARAVARLSVPTTLKSAAGQDPDAEVLRKLLVEGGVDVHLVSVEGGRTGQYLALHDPNGSLAAAVADIAILESLPADGLLPLESEIEDAGLWFFDANLPSPVLECLAGLKADRFLAADAVSMAKAPRLSAILPKLDLLFLNAEEARHLSGKPAVASLNDVSRALIDAGPAAVVITDGPRPVHVRSHEIYRTMNSLSVEIADVTGAGDALVAGTLAALARGRPLPAAVETGISASALALTHRGAGYPALSWTAICTPSTVSSRQH